ncbi:MAG: YfjI family protein, partial [Novosphingobium sp.]|uniref:YfjI family protein n=1 Tax=Novosphingobium sp. TaxID=1874826 RepID=UPI00301A0675
IGRRAGIKPQANTDWMETANLWGCIVARPGAAKSPVLSQVLAPINRLEAKAAREHAEAIKLHNAGQSFLKLERVAVERQIKEALESGVSPTYREQATQQLLGLEASEAPSEKRFLTSDCTAEKLGEICAANPDGVLVHRDELMTMFADLDREEKVSARGFFLSGWGGNQAYTFDRIGRGTIRIPAVNLSVIGTSQPKRLGAYIASTLRNLDDGMVQRLQLMSMPDLNGKFVEADRPPDAQARGRAFECFEGLAQRRFVEIGAELDPDTGHESVPFFRFSEAARQTFSDWRTDLENRLADPAADLAPALVAHLSKYRGLIPRIAMICHLASGGEGPVSVQAVQQALDWAEYLEAHARRIYAMAPSADSSLAARAILRKIQSGQLADGFTAREIKQKGWAGLRDPEVRAGLELLVELDWLRKIDVRPKAGRSTAIYRVNPRALTGPAKR